GGRVKNSASKLAPGIDVRGDGGYVIVPPSAGYTLADDAPVADVPTWLLPALMPPDPAPALVPVAPRPRMEPIEDGGTPYAVAALPPAPPPELHPAAGLIAKAHARAAKPAAAAPAPVEVPIPDAVYDVDGVLKLMLDHCLATAWRPQPFLSLGAVITAVGVAA